MQDVRAYRAEGIDILRGLVIVIMALDHVREYFMQAVQLDPTANPEASAAQFFTRWITHLCAPVFVFLAGTSAGLMSRRKTPVDLGSFLFKRGCWLIAIEWLVVSTGWTFAPTGIEELGDRVLVVLQVIWAIGIGMIVLAGAQFLGRKACLVIGLLIVVAHNLLDGVWPVTGAFATGAPWWVVLHSQSSFVAGPFQLMFFYPLLAWCGVMLFGFGTAAIFEQQPERRDAQLVKWGVITTVLFLVLRAAGAYGDPNPWERHDQPLGTLLDFLSVTKYPPSFLFLLMTLGPAALLCAYVERLPEAVRRPLAIFGRAPFAFYVAHIYVVHALSVALGVLQGFEARQFLTFMIYYPKEYGLGLAGVYAAWILVVAALYPFTRWVATIKARRRDWWLSYV